MLYSEIIAVCSEIHTKHIINTLCGQNVQFVNVKHGGTYSNHWALEGYLKQKWRRYNFFLLKFSLNFFINLWLHDVFSFGPYRVNVLLRIHPGAYEVGNHTVGSKIDPYCTKYIRVIENNSFIKTVLAILLG
jgi:hypothetical protein